MTPYSNRFDVMTTTPRDQLSVTRGRPTHRVASIYQFKRSGWSKQERDRVAGQLIQHGFNDTVEYPTVRHFIESLPLLYQKEDLILYQDRNVLSYLNYAWINDRDGMHYDFVRAVQLHHAVMSRVFKIECRMTPTKVSKYCREISLL